MNTQPQPERTIPGPVIVLPVLVFAAAIVSIAAYWLFSTAHSAPGPPPSIAILPFEGDRLGDGIARQIIAELSPIAGFETIAWPSSAAMRGQQDARQIGQKLNVRNVVLGSVEKSGDQVKVSARLIRADDGDQLWSKSYDRDASEIFAIEDEISGALVDALGLKPVVPLDHAKPTSLEAYGLYLAGSFEEAIQSDPRYAPAYAALAESDRLAGSIPKARAEAEKALELDPRNAAAHVVLGEIRAVNDWDWNGARGEFERALAIDSADTDALHWMATMVLAPAGRVKDAIGEVNRAMDLDPLNPAPAADLGLLLYLDRQSDAAIAQLKKTGSTEARELLQRISHDAGEAGEKETAFDAACADAKLGDKTRALDELDRAYDQHDWLLAYLKTWPELDPLRSEPRFQALVKKMNLAQ
jgi:TolB-like protein/tetratricopeptide (TPR) repeat protein